MRNTFHRRQGNFPDRLTPVGGIVTEVQLLQLHHQTRQVSATDARAFTQHPVVTQRGSDQRCALNRKVLFITLAGIEAGNHVVSVDETRRVWTKMVAETVLRQVASLFTEFPVNNGCQGFAA
ncbi:hypothetical protein D3C76_1103350 [compost metagenome]